jgi:hypothetical protein
MESVQLALSAKQHAALRKGRKIRLNAAHMNGSGVQYKVHPATYDRIRRRLSMDKGIDLALDPTEIQASMLGGSLTNKLKRAGKVLNFIGNDIIQPIATFVKPVAKPIFSALTNLGVSKINNMADPSARYLNAAERGIDIYNELSHPQRNAWTQGPTTDTPSMQSSMIQLATAAALQNAFAPSAPKSDPVGTYTPGIIDTARSRPTLASHAGYGIHFLHHRPGTFQGRGAAFHPLHAARLSNAMHTGFMQQIPQVYKDAARLASGSGLYL